MRLLIRQITISILASLHAAREVTSRICLLLPARHVFLPSSQQHNKPLERVPYESQHPHVVVMYIAKHGISSRHLSFPVREGERQTFSLSRSPTFPTSSCELLRERTRSVARQSPTDCHYITLRSPNSDDTTRSVRGLLANKTPFLTCFSFTFFCSDSRSFWCFVFVRGKSAQFHRLCVWIYQRSSKEYAKLVRVSDWLAQVLVDGWNMWSEKYYQFRVRVQSDTTVSCVPAPLM